MKPLLRAEVRGRSRAGLSGREQASALHQIAAASSDVSLAAFRRETSSESNTVRTHAPRPSRERACGSGDRFSAAVATQGVGTRF
jgi:hypothetical protein